MPSWSRRGQVEPLAALAAVLAVAVGLTLYVGVLDATLPDLTADRGLAAAAADRFVAEARSFGAIATPIDEPARAARPTGHELNATLRSDGRAWAAGPERAPAADCVTRWVSVGVAPGRVRPGRLEVCTWPVA